MKRTTIWLRTLIAGGALLLGACATGASGSETTTHTSETPQLQTHAIEVRGFLFDPDDIEISVGDTVTWTNQDRILHTVTAGPDDPRAAYDGQLDGAGSTFSVTFGEVGTHEYFCARHPHMRGIIVVG